jgi:hypothetical protein
MKILAKIVRDIAIIIGALCAIALCIIGIIKFLSYTFYHWWVQTYWKGWFCSSSPHITKHSKVISCNPYFHISHMHWGLIVGMLLVFLFTTIIMVVIRLELEEG